MIRSAWVLATLVLVLAARTADAQFLQLPSFQVFSVQTSVLAPDRGGTSLGGGRRSAGQSTSRGWPGGGRLLEQRALAGGGGQTHSSVHATIIDHRAWDVAVREEAARRRGDTTSRFGEAPSNAASGRWPGTGQADEVGRLSLAEIRAQRQAEQAALGARARERIELARQAEADGKPGVARMLWRQAVADAPSDLRAEVHEALRRLATPPRSARAMPPG